MAQDHRIRMSRREALGLFVGTAAGLAGASMATAPAAGARRRPRDPLTTRLTRELGISAPIVGAGMGFYSGPALAAAISEAGGLGVLGAAAEPPPRLRSLIRDTRALTRRPFGVDLVNTTFFGAGVPGVTDLHIEVCAQEGVPLVVFFWDPPEATWVARLHQVGTKVWMAVASVEGALAAIDAGVDGLIATGSQAGGHSRGAFEGRALPRADLVPRIVEAAGGRLVLGAGGIATGQGVADTLDEGADGAWIGTRFAASTESNAHADYKRRVVEASERDVVLTTLFGPEWPDAPGWALRNRVVDQWAGREDEVPVPPPPPAVIGTTSFAGLPYAMPKFSAVLPTVDTQGDFDEMWFAMGPQSASLIHDVKPAGQIVTELAAEAAAIRRGAGRPLAAAVRS